MFVDDDGLFGLFSSQHGLNNYRTKIIVFFFQAEDGIRDHCVTGVQTCALPIFSPWLALSPIYLAAGIILIFLSYSLRALRVYDYFRSEERRVGKECRSRWSP